MARGDSEELLQTPLRARVAESQRASEVLKRLREFFRTGTTSLAPVALPALVGDMLASFADQAAREGVRLEAGPLPDACVLGDRVQLEIVLRNLLANAIQALAELPEGLARRVTVDAGLERGKVWIRIADNGPGIAASIRARLFEPFVSLKSSGLGLGLAISRRLIECMDGRIWAENNTGRGATFAFDLSAPIAFIERDEPTNVADLDSLHLQARPHVLIADDNATNRVVAQALCEMFGCTSETVEDGQEAVEAVQSRPFDLILMDIKMPRLDGVGATRAIRALDGPQRDIPIIALTANADPDDAKAYLAAGMAAVVEKPIKPERLRLAMNTALEPANAAPARARDVA
jgi:CheY-like chemotaxis protein